MGAREPLQGGPKLHRLARHLLAGSSSMPRAFLRIFLLVALATAASARAHALPRGDAHGRAAVTTLRGTVRWSASRTQRLSGRTVMAPGSELVIEAGTRIEADPGSVLIVPRDARLRAIGTLLEPIVFTCTGGVKVPGCWGGLVIAGNAPINHGTPTSPAARGSGASGCLEYPDDESPYGGCPLADSSGVLVYARIEFATFGLRLLGLGSATRIERVQVHRALGDGVYVAGGRVNLRFLVLTANGQYGLHWTGGWTGSAQYIIAQGDPSFTAGGVLGENGGVGSATDNATPRSAPSVANLTVVLPSSASNPYNGLPARALVLDAGTAGDVRDVVIYQSSVALDVVGATACAQAGTGALRLRGIVTAGATLLGPTGTSAQSCGAYTGTAPEALWLADAGQGNVVVTDPATIATFLLNGTNIVIPDLRPVWNSPAATLPVIGGGPAFFDVVAYRGAVEPAEPGRTNIPWYSGWTFSEILPAPAPATLAGIVYSTVRGPLPGIGLSLAPSQRSAVSAATGAYAIASIPPGPVRATLAGVPAGCTTPAAESFTLAAGASVTRDFGVPCTPLAETAIDAGAAHACALTAAGEAWCWGANDRGQLGTGSTASSPVPMKAQSTSLFQAISVSNLHACGLTSSRLLQCWGGNDRGQLGLGDRADRLVPTMVTGGPWLAVSAGVEHSCAVATNGQAWCWGQNNSGQLGQGDTTARLVPTPVFAPVAFAGISAGGLHTCAWTAAGVAYCWGSNVTGALGNALPQALTPVAVNTGLRFTSISAGESYTCGVTTATAAYCWGTNVMGQLGVGSIGGQPLPAVIAGNPAVASIGAAAEATILSHTCTVLLSGAGWCWGHDSSGQLGTETTSVCTYAFFQLPCSLSPLPVDGGLVFARIVAGGSHSCGLTRSHEVWCWGANDRGQLGDGTTTGSLAPVKVSTSLVFP